MRLLLFLTLLLSTLAATAQPRVALKRIEAATDTGQVILSNSDLDGEWSSTLQWADSVFIVGGGLRIDTIRPGATSDVLTKSATGRVEYRTFSDLASGYNAVSGTGTTDYLRFQTWQAVTMRSPGPAQLTTLHAG